MKDSNDSGAGGHSPKAPEIQKEGSSTSGGVLRSTMTTSDILGPQHSLTPRPSTNNLQGSERPSRR